MIQTTTGAPGAPRCPLCPALCEVSLAQAGPDGWRTEYPLAEGTGLCPRGAALGGLLGHRRRIFAPRRRAEGQWRPEGLGAILEQLVRLAGDGGMTVLLDGGSIPCEQMAAVAAWCRAWPAGRLCLVVEPAEEELLLGLEASGADYLGGPGLGQCDGFLIVGDAFAGNPTLARAVFDRRRKVPRMPLAVIDPGAGKAAKFATAGVDTPPGGELAALEALAAGAGLDVPGCDGSRRNASAVAAGKALAGCKRLGVLIAAEHGRSRAWRQIGFLAGRLAKAFGGGVAPQTTGANALAAVRMARRVGAVSLAAALSGPGLRLAIGCDVLGMLGWSQPAIQAAAAALPNRTTASASVVLPLALPAELGGTFLAGAEPVRSAAMLPPPAGVQTPAELVEALARAAGASRCDSPVAGLPERVSLGSPSPAKTAPEPPASALLLGRQAAHAGCGAITGYGAWQEAAASLPEVRLSAQDARQAGVKDMQVVTLQADGQSARARVRIVPELPPGRMVLSEGFGESRALLPCTLDASGGLALAEPRVAEIVLET